jgi:hypothetical protein
MENDHGYVDVCVLVDSLRKASFNGMLANALISLAPSLLTLDIVEIGQMPFNNQDLETDPPPAPWTAFRQRVKAADAVLFVTPEYNRSVAAVLKKCTGCRLQAVWKQRLGPQAWCGGQRFAGRDRGLRRQSSSQAVARVSECADHAAARSLCRSCRQALR